jgi:ornithine carbamoyltransferase
LTDEDHPTQLLADWVVITEKFGSDYSNRKLVYLGDGNNMANAWLLMGALMGAHVVAVTPPGKFSVREEVIKRAENLAKSTGGKIEISHDVDSVKDASVLYTDVWLSMGDSETERSERIKALSPYAVTDDLMELALKDAIFMHCLPAHRGEEVAANVIDGGRSVVWQQAFHRRTTIQALLYHLTRGDL